VTQIGPITCPHCGAANPSTGTFCESCGKALPSAVASSPRVTSSVAGFAGTDAGRSLQAGELQKQAK
jgi:predicted amidophosphoribosyltransferase